MKKNIPQTLVGNGEFDDSRENLSDFGIHIEERRVFGKLFDDPYFEYRQKEIDAMREKEAEK